ncbi:hypothetical protein HMPREF0183_0159 [Brevibacterium mcbrellneri ATCC 49030]|uniref:Uncharacterized protein n=1 Tax=Brevibacterium mcbrellneri ATCC 49030 TaxID=585530 RepID=D4YJP9_9MICO|nr:hypothetical protein HMPREF0183_0159 [Brevibacterium mcbrellneri ATCC 49030]
MLRLHGVPEVSVLVRGGLNPTSVVWDVIGLGRKWFGKVCH